MAYLPMAVYGLEVPPGDMAISARPDIPAAFRITMAAIDPTAEAEDGSTGLHRATLKIIRLPITSDDYDIDSDEDSDEDDFDPEEMEAMLAEEEGDEDDEDDEDEEDEEDEDEEADVNGGPSDPAKSKKARKAAAIAQIKSLLAEEGMDVDEDGVVNGLNGVVKSAKAKGKQPVTDLDQQDNEDNEDDFSDDEDGAEIEEYVVCTLDTEKQYQQALDIAIGEDERVWFKVSGSHSIFLTGNYIEPVDASYDEDDEDDSELDYDLEPDEDEIDELDELDDLSSRVVEVGDDDDEEEDVPALVGAGKKNKKRAVEEADISEDLDDMIAKDKKLSKKQAKKLKKNDGTAAEINGTSSGKKVAFAKEIEQGPTPSKNAPGQPASKSVSVKTVNGVTLDDRKIGTGPVAKKGDRVGLRYIGKLKDGKVFDANKQGKPFTFKLGSGEVIKGWDIGVAGMSVGGERRIIIPPHLAYGSKSIPDIPANSTLTFDVKVLEINKGK